jgi:2-polyprenyl-3-methyl-5-hydroxy-6-metoxy-1,4-benzoquinol methylase
MPDRSYRTALYEKYISVQAPDWGRDTAESSATWAAATLSRVRGWLPPDRSAKCVDLGCGSGRLLGALRGAGYFDVRGVDLGPQAVGLARKAGFQITQADLREYLLGSHECFDLITAFDVIEHFGKDEILELLHLVRIRLTPNGRFIIQTPNACSPWASSYRYGDLTHEVIFDARCLTSALRLADFGEVYAREVAPYIHGVKSAVRWLGWRLIWCGCALWNLIETGSTQGGIYTRNMILLCVNNKNSQC